MMSMLLANGYVLAQTPLPELDADTLSGESLSFFEYLGAMVEDPQDGWIDPLELVDDFADDADAEQLHNVKSNAEPVPEQEPEQVAKPLPELQREEAP